MPSKEGNQTVAIYSCHLRVALLVVVGAVGERDHRLVATCHIRVVGGLREGATFHSRVGGRLREGATCHNRAGDRLTIGEVIWLGSTGEVTNIAGEHGRGD